MFNKLFTAFSAGALGGAANVIFLITAGIIGVPALLGLELPSFAKVSFFYKQVVWGGLWALLFATPLMPRNWLKRALIITPITAAATFFVFFPIGTVDGNGPGVAGLNIGIFMPVFVLLADLAYGLVASKVYQVVGADSN